jgi:hypothetical protein
MDQPAHDNVGCDHAPFSPEHVHCVCRVTNAAADELERLAGLLNDDQYIEMRAAYARVEKSWANMINEREARKQK